MMLLLLPFACTPDLASRHRWDDGIPEDTSDTGVHPSIEFVPSDVLWTATVDARDATSWVGLDLDVPAEVATTDPGWDLRFQRFHMSANGGIGGDGGVQVLFVPGASLDAVPAVPEGPWISDAPDGDDEDNDPDYALSRWYDYNEATHVLTPVPGVWFVRTTEASVYALSIDTYYDAVGSSGQPRLRWLGPLGSTTP